MTVSLRVVDTDHLILFFVKLRGSPNLSQPGAHSCVVVAAKAAAAIRSIAGASKNVLFILFPFPERSLFEANQKLSSGLILLTSSPGTGFCVSVNYLPTGLAYVATSDLAETPGTARRLGIVNLIPGEAFGIGAVAFFRRSVMSSMRMPSKPRRIATMR